MLNKEKLDRELEELDVNSEEGMAKIKKAKALLPVHYDNLIESIGGVIEQELDYNRLPKSISNMVKLFNREAPFLGEVANVMTATLVYSNLYGKFRPYIYDSIVSKKTKIPANVFVVSFSDSGNG